MPTYSAVHLAQRPKDEIIPGTFKVKQHEVPKESSLKDGEVIIQSLYLSLDPAMRGWLNGLSAIMHSPRSLTNARRFTIVYSTSTD